MWSNSSAAAATFAFGVRFLHGSSAHGSVAAVQRRSVMIEIFRRRIVRLRLAESLKCEGSQHQE